MDSQHNPDELMGEEELGASFSVESFFAEEAVTPAVSAPPPAKRVCAAGSSSSAPVAPRAASVVPPVTPVMAPVAGPSSAAPAPSTSTQEANPVVALAITGRYQRLRRNRETVGVVVAALARDTGALVVNLFPEALEAHRSHILTRVRSILRGRDFSGGRVPVFEASAGELLRLPRRSYCRHMLQWPSVDDANRFKQLLPITYRSSEGPTAEIKVYQDPAPDFSAAKARGETVLVLRNVPVDFAVQTLRSLLVSSASNGARWLGDLLFFHKLFDPYEESFLPQMLCIAVAPPNDPLFEAIPAVIWVPNVQEPIVVNISAHSCGCHFPFAPWDFLCFLDPFLTFLFMPGAGPVWLWIIGQHPSVASFKADPGTVFIGTDLEVEVWTCALCSFCCGWALDSAMEHIAISSHASAIQQIAGNSTPLEEFGDMKAHVFNQNSTIASFLSQG
ncbi:unnamed protein product [Closterium sp. Naga37s-1]|nr:unnamed protein product [Closterium sp. Naga37s-1]